jgi:hypothetical protein
MPEDEPETGPQETGCYPIISKSYPKKYPFITILFITFNILLYPVITKKTYPYIPMYGYKYWIAWVKMWIE